MQFLIFILIFFTSFTVYTQSIHITKIQINGLKNQNINEFTNIITDCENATDIFDKLTSLKKALLLFRKSNPPLLEWLRSPIVYCEKYSAADKLREATKEYFNPKSCLYHYLHMADGNYEAYFKEDIVRLKKYFYVLRPLLACSWIERTGQMAPMEFDTLLENEINDKNLANEILKLLKVKKSEKELAKGARIKVIDDFIVTKLNHFKEYLTDFNFNNIPSFERLNIIFRDTLKESWE